jgi:hypothetical protein
MQTQGVDVGALLRRVAPMWLAWVLLAMPTAWIVVGYQAASGTGEFLGVSQTSNLGGDGTSQIEPPSVSRLPQVFIALVLGLGNFGSTFELPLLGLAGAAGVAVLWVGQGRRAGVRAVSATGAVISLGLVFIGFGVVLSREPLSTSFSSVGMESMTVVDAQFAAWGLTGLFAAILCWVFLRLGFGPVPRVAPTISPEVVADAVPTASPAPEPAGGVTPEPADEVTREVEPEPMRTTEVTFERLVETVEADPLAVYRRPSGS